jgi:sugar/nucleoside kinase (ribokinase family)
LAKKLSAIVAGHLCLDIIPQIIGIAPEAFRAAFMPGHLIDVGPVALSTGGPVSNTGLALHKLGVPTQLMGKIGDDLFGQAVTQLVSAYDPRLVSGMVVDLRASTSYTVVINPPGVDRIFLHCHGANDTFSADDVRYDLLDDVGLFHFGYPPLMKLMYADGGTQLSSLYRRAKATGVTTSLDMAFPGSSSVDAPWRRILALTLPYVDIFLPSIEEILVTLRRETYERMCAEALEGDILPAVTPELLAEISGELLAMGAKIVGLKLGYRGIYLHTASEAVLQEMGRARPSDVAAWADRELWAPCFQVDVVGTAGSGDATIAGFLSALLRDMTPEEAVNAAVAVGACNVEAADTLSGVRSWHETLRRMAAGWPRRSEIVTTPGWRFDEPRGLWIGPAANG